MMMISRWLTPILLCGFAAGLFASQPAIAATAQQKSSGRLCISASNDDERIAGCTAILATRIPPGVRMEALQYRSFAYSRKGEHRLALADISEAIRMKPDSASMRSRRGQVFAQMRDFKSAVTEYSDAIKLETKSSDLYNRYNNRGTAYKDAGEFDRAVADFNEAIRLNPKYDGAFVNRGIVWFERGEFDRALSDYDQAISLNPKAARNYSNRGNALKAKGELDRAIADFDTAIRLDPKYAHGYALRGSCWGLKGDLDRALADQNRAVELNPKGLFVHLSRGDTYRYRGEFVAAVADYEQALLAEPDYLPAIVSLGLTYERMGEPGRARAQFEQAVSSQNQLRFIDIHKSAVDAARARIAALDSGVAQPVIPVSQHKVVSETAIPTPVLAPAAKPTGQKPAPSAAQGRRVALVIGNSIYKNVPVLNNPQKDAEIIGASLRNIGFDQVTVIADASREKLVDALRTFAEEADRSDWAMVYYAGHGIEIGGQNFLIPIEAKLAADRDVTFEAIGLDQVKTALGGAKKIRLIVLDACRVNPFAQRMRQTETVAAAAQDAGGAAPGTRAIGGRGLARVETGISGPQLIVFAAKDGQVALDGEGANSPFAVAMVQRIATPGVEINKVFRLVRDDVMESTAGRQEPYTYGSLPGREDFYFIASK